MAIAIPTMAPLEDLLPTEHSLALDMTENNRSINFNTLGDCENPNSDEDTDDENKKSRKPHQVSEKRKAQKVVFQTFINRHAKTLFKAARKAELASSKDEELSIASILAEQQSETITDPREYQMELFERAKKDNLIAVLDTGSGKTLIAVLLLRHILDQELEDRATGREPRLSFFLVCLTSSSLSTAC
jgi:endoribonuclease Dicer